MREFGIHDIVFSSSCAVYGAPEAIPISEENHRAPVNPYGATKMICENMLLECAAAFPLTFMALRYFNAAGGDPDGEIGECHVPETHVIRYSSTWLRARRIASRLSAMTILPRTEPASAITSTSATSRTAMFRRCARCSVAPKAPLRTRLVGARSNRLRAPSYQSGHSRPSRSARPGDPPVLIAEPTEARHRLDRQPRYADLAT